MKKAATIAIVVTIGVLALIAAANQDKIKEEAIRFPFQIQKAEIYLEHLPDVLDDLLQDALNDVYGGAPTP